MTTATAYRSITPLNERFNTTLISTDTISPWHKFDYISPDGLHYVEIKGRAVNSTDYDDTIVGTVKTNWFDFNARRDATAWFVFEFLDASYIIQYNKVDWNERFRKGTMYGKPHWFIPMSALTRIC